MHGVVLAGGKSSRMGTPKELLVIEGQTLIERTCGLLLETTEECMVISNSIGRLPHLPASISIVADDVPDQGPLGGIATAMRCSRQDKLLVVACDMPKLTKEAFRIIVQQAAALEEDVLLPSYRGKQQPLCAVYSKRLYPLITHRLARGSRKIFDLFQEASVREFDMTDCFAYDIFCNMNTPDDYEKIRKEET